MSAALQTELMNLLGEDCSLVTERLRAKFDEIGFEVGETLVLFGAGFLGQRTLKAIRDLGIEPVAFSDNNPKLWNQHVGGLLVLPPTVAVRQYGQQAVFVVTIYNSSNAKRQLRELGCRAVADFCHLYWKYAEFFLPYCALDFPKVIFQQTSEILDAFHLWADEASRDRYVAQLRWRLFLDFDNLPPPSAASDLYFPEDLVTPMDSEVFLDCGAFDGDTTREFLKRRKDRFKAVLALEPDPTSYGRLRQYVASLPETVSSRVALREVAASAMKGMLFFDAHGDIRSSISAAGGTAIECDTLDAIMADVPPTYVKMDIEGAETAALLGAKGILATHNPALAICLYHRQEDLWKLPALIHSLSDKYKLFLRSHAEQCWELVCYAIPPERVAGAAETTSQSHLTARSA